MKSLSIKYDFDEAARVYITSESDVIGINLWDKNLHSLLNRVAHCAPTFIQLNHPELQGSDAIELSFEPKDGAATPIVWQISLTPQGPKPGLNGFSQSFS